MPNDHFDLAVLSNYLEHLPSTEAVLQQLRVTFALLKPGGRVLILQPNIRLNRRRVLDFIDHQTALTERAWARRDDGGFSTKQVIHALHALPPPRAGCRSIRCWSGLTSRFPRPVG